MSDELGKCVATTETLGKQHALDVITLILEWFKVPLGMHSGSIRSEPNSVPVLAGLRLRIGDDYSTTLGPATLAYFITALE